MKIAEVEQAKVEYFMKKVAADTSGLAATVMAALGDRLGLFKDLATNGPTVSSDFLIGTILMGRLECESQPTIL